MSASPIRDADGKLCITPGVWEMSRLANGRVFAVISDGVGDIAAGLHWGPEANAALIAEAGTVTNATNRTPAELAALVRELREALATYRKHDPYFVDDNLLAKSEGV